MVVGDPSLKKNIKKTNKQTKLGHPCEGQHARILLLKGTPPLQTCTINPRQPHPPNPVAAFTLSHRFPVKKTKKRKKLCAGCTMSCNSDAASVVVMHQALQVLRCQLPRESDGIVAVLSLQIIYLKKTPEEAYRPLVAGSNPPFLPFR